MNSLRKHLSYANILATLALLFAMSGGALAAKHYLVTSTSQISPKVLRSLANTNKVLFNKLAKTATVAEAGIANTAATATTAGSATNATNATDAGNATTAMNALSLGGIAAGGYQQRCATGSVAAFAEWYASGLPTDGTYVAPDRFGGETGFACEGTGLTATLLSAGWIRVKINGLPESPELVGFVNADSRGGTPLIAYATGPAAGGIFDVHVSNEKGVATNPGYLDLELLDG
jgi:hypothetical protein